MHQIGESQEALAQSERRFRKAVEEAPQPIMIFAEDGEVLTLSHSWSDITGYRPEQLQTLDAWTELAYGTGKHPIRAHIEKLFELESRVDEGEFTITYADGTQRIWMFSSTPLHRLPDNRRIVMSIAADVTERRQAEEAARRNHNILQRIFDNSHYLLAYMDAEFNFIQVNTRYAEADHKTPDYFIGKNHFDLYPKDMLIHYFDRLTPEKRIEKLEGIGRQVQFALELLEDTVNVARGNLSKSEFAPSPVNIAALCQVSVDEIQIANQMKYRLHFINLTGMEVASIDEGLVSRILLNLLSNAIKYSPDESEIRLELDRQDEWIMLRVVDKGMGISEDDLNHIFEPFYRAEAVEHVSGTGLGLSIVKDCVNRHRGHISVESAVEHGTTFTVKLPFVTAGVLSVPVMSKLS